MAFGVSADFACNASMPGKTTSMATHPRQVQAPMATLSQLQLVQLAIV